MIQFNVYDLKWNYLGTYWGARSVPVSLGDIHRKIFSGRLLDQVRDREVEVQSQMCFIKIVEIKEA